MKFTIEAENIEELILAAKSLINCTDGKAEKPEAEKPAKAAKSRAKKTEEPAPVEEKAEEVPFTEDPKTEEPKEEVPAPVEEAKPEAEAKVYSLEDIRNKVKEYTRSGRKDEMREILKEFGASRSTDLKEEQYASFMERCHA